MTGAATVYYLETESATRIHLYPDCAHLQRSGAEVQAGAPSGGRSLCNRCERRRRLVEGLR